MAYNYEKQLWKDYPDTTTPITADRLNHMEDGISEAAKSGGGDTIPVGSEFDYDGTTVPEGFVQVDDPNVYSTKEKRVGTWFGKPLYRKYLNFNLVKSTIYNSISHNISDIDDIFKIEGRVYDGTEFYIIPASLPTDNVPKYGVAIQSITKSKINMYTGTENKTRNMNCKIFIYYTKTTDTVEEE